MSGVGFPYILWYISDTRSINMCELNIIPRSLLSLGFLAMICLVSVSVNAQKGPQGTAGAPLKGVDIKLGKNPGGSPAARAASDKDGHFTIPNVAKGSYILTFELKKETVNNTNTARASDPPAKFCYITLNLPGGKKVEMGYDLVRNQTFNPAIDPIKLSTLKVKDFQDFVIVVPVGGGTVDGVIVRSKSNITNN